MQQYLEDTYQYFLNENHCKNNLIKKTETQGEILYESISKVLSHLAISDQDCFIDIGSGLGKVVLQFFLMTSVKQAIGIEIVPEWHKLSSCVLDEMKNKFSNIFNQNRKIFFVNADVLKIHLPSESTILFINSTCFSQILLYEINKLIKNLPNLNTILTTRPFYFIHDGFIFQKSIAIECSWDSAICYVYKKIDSI